MKGFLNLILFFLVSCSLFNKRINIEQVNDTEEHTQGINTHHLIMQEKQSLSIAMLQIEQNKSLEDKVVIVEAKSLLYTVDKGFGIRLAKTSILPEALRLFSLSNRLKLTTIILCKNNYEEKAIRNALKDNNGPDRYIKYSYATDLRQFSELKPILIVGESYESLWGDSKSNNLSKRLWFSVWVPLQNSQRSKISQDDWVKFL